MKKEKYDEYELKARIWPVRLVGCVFGLNITAILISIPTLNETLNQFFSYYEYVLGGVFTFSAMKAFEYYLASMSQTVSKIVFQYPLYGKKETRMPTTEYLLWKDKRLSEKSEKRVIHDRVKSEFGVKLYSKSKEREDEQGARKEIVVAVKHILDNYREDKITKSYNIKYGYSRNMLGGLVISVFSTIAFWAIACVLSEQILPITSLQLVLAGITLFMLLTGIGMAVHQAELFASKLLRAYMRDSCNKNINQNK